MAAKKKTKRAAVKTKATTRTRQSTKPRSKNTKTATSAAKKTRRAAPTKSARVTKPARTAKRTKQAGSSKRTTSSSDAIRTRIHSFAAKALKDGDAALRELPKFTREVVVDAAKGLNDAVPQSSRNVLRQVVDAMTDAAVVTTHSVRNAFNDSTSRGADFARKDAARTMRDLRDLETNFISALDRARSSLTGVAKDELDSIVKHAKRAGTRVGPAAQSAMRAADGRLPELGVETAKATVRVTRRTVGGMLDGASGLLQALGEAVTGRTPR